MDYAYTFNMLVHVNNKGVRELFDLCFIFRKMMLIILILTATFVPQGAGYTYILKQSLNVPSGQIGSA